MKYPKAEQKMGTILLYQNVTGVLKTAFGMQSINAMHKTPNERKVEKKPDQEIAKNI